MDSSFLKLTARRLRSLSMQFRDWIERHRSAEEALNTLHAMSDRELHDIGISRSEIDRVARARSAQPRLESA